MAYGICVEVWGDRALFTRPELSVERVSYDAMIPALREGCSRAFTGIRACATPSTIHVLNPIPIHERAPKRR